MKLYTEEEIVNFLETHWEDDIDSEWFLKQLTPIELPSDEEIEKYLKSFPYTKHLDDGQYNDGVIVGAELAIEWMRSKLVTFKSE